MSSGPKDARVSFPWARSTTKSQGGRPFSAQHTNAVRRPDSAARASELGTVKRRTPKRTLTVSGPVAQLDRAPDYESGGRRFESFRARLHRDIREARQSHARYRPLKNLSICNLLPKECGSVRLRPGRAVRYHRPGDPRRIPAAAEGGRGRKQRPPNPLGAPMPVVVRAGW